MELKEIAKSLRARIIRNSYRAEIPHLGSCLSCVDILVLLYYEILQIDPLRHQDPQRDRFILSKGHAAPALFQILAMKGFYTDKLLEGYGEDGGLFAEHPPAPPAVPGVEVATGSLGHGLPMAVGMALSERLSNRLFNVYALLSDGECNEGTVWEAALFAAAQKLTRLYVIVDFNKWQATGKSCEVMPLSRLAEMWRAFGWNSIEVNGHDFTELRQALASRASDRPTAIIAHTIKGKGVSFMEDNNDWHYRIPTENQLEAAIKELGMPS